MKQTPLLAIGDYFSSMYGHLSVKKWLEVMYWSDFQNNYNFLNEKNQNWILSIDFFNR